MHSCVIQNHEEPNTATKITDSYLNALLQYAYKLKGFSEKYLNMVKF